MLARVLLLAGISSAAAFSSLSTLPLHASSRVPAISREFPSHIPHPAACALVDGLGCPEGFSLPSAALIMGLASASIGPL
jgi:hypothetical protein